MQFLIIARDGRDARALERRLKVRAQHLANAERLQHAGHLLIGGALLDDDGQMIGSAAVAEFDSRAELDDWLRTDPYVTGHVWQHIEVIPYRVAPHYTFTRQAEQSVKAGA
ncbi:MAG: hypothetical protein FJX68_01350 [Alphaproteobacteria bacterium]|nr:hypothetical protein [Alphaproteobacteria bacterium]